MKTIHALALASDGLRKAQAKHGPMRGVHEGYAVILEELDELWDEIKRQPVDSEAIRREATHVAAMGLRFLADLCEPPSDEVETAALERSDG